MTSKSNKSQDLPNLLVPRQEAVEKIQAQIDKGIALRNKPMHSVGEVELGTSEFSKWKKYTQDLLRRLFDSDEYYKEFSHQVPTINRRPPTWEETINDYFQEVNTAIVRLESIRDRLDLVPEPNALAPIAGVTQSREVFVVYGHDDASKEKVARFLERLDLIVILLDERPSKGKTIIEKIEAYSEVSFAVVLLTPDDVGAEKNNSKNLIPRARQNVIFELGYFIGKLGRPYVCALYADGVENLSDFGGVVYVKLDSAGAWKQSLYNEIAASGIVLDPNKFFQS